MNKLKTFMYGLFLLSSLSLVTPVLANDIYITQSGDDLDLDITQDGQNNVAGTSGTGITLSGDTMTFNIDQIGNSNVVSAKINGDTYTGNIDLTGNSNNVALLCDSTGTAGSGNCETVSMSIDVTGSSATVVVSIGENNDAVNFVGTMDITSAADETVTLTVDGKNADADIDITNSNGSVGNTAVYDINDDGDINGHSLTHSHTGDGGVINITQSGLYDNKVQLTTSGDDAEIDITQDD
tara:strand:+ start:802 stop:1518 length:717 start_codon:yes stop_codon:yes gene_type:complete